ncbi:MULTISPECIES: AAA family ATPase [Kosakonia]|uniref:AAA family ATPase n=1 Tax=Kosakonia TaxID=1330547 RepID=UPI000BE5FF03|nr:MULTISPECIES: ATP-binding protein [Kosakonia]MCZ3383522.1 ATP-binding protein [Kosakonia sp. SOY2]PDO88802.1 cell division protein ZipA [Kosakonia sacchari]QHM93492.1 ATP-binding protein [Kosakonia sacchari]
MNVCSASSATLHLLCGKIASGKSTLASELAKAPCTVVLSEDSWLSLLFKDAMTTVEDYVFYSAKLKSAIKPHAIALLRAGVNVVLDFPANTLASRQWMMSIVNESGAPHLLHYLPVSDEICKARLRQRNAAGDHDFAATDEQFALITRYFVEPTEQEGFRIVRY